MPARSDSGTDSPRERVCDPVAFWRGFLVGILLSLIVWSAVIAAIVQ